MIAFLLAVFTWETILGFLNDHYDWLTFFKDWSGVVGFSFSAYFAWAGKIQNGFLKRAAIIVSLVFGAILVVMIVFLPNYRRNEIGKILTKKVAISDSLLRHEITIDLLIKKYEITEIDAAIDSLINRKEIEIYEATQHYPMSGGRTSVDVKIQQIRHYTK